MQQKEFKSIEEQLTILKSRGLNIIDEEDFKNFLLNNNYYRISGYTLSLRKNDVFNKNITSSSVIEFHHSYKQVYVSRMYYKPLKEKMKGRR